MEPWLMGIVVTVLIAIIGWLVARNHTLNQVVATQRETIDTLKRQVDRYEVIDQVTEQVLKSLPQSRAPGSKR